MKFLKKILVLIIVMFVGFSCVFSAGSINTSSASTNNVTTSNNWDSNPECIKLNTDIPWLSRDNCIKPDDAWNVFWKVMWGLMKLAINITVAVAFISLIVAGIMYSMSWVSQSTAGKWKELVKKVILWIILLWLSWIILHTINPNFFTTEEITFVLIKNL